MMPYISAVEGKYVPYSVSAGVYTDTQHPIEVRTYIPKNISGLNQWEALLVGKKIR